MSRIVHRQPVWTWSLVLFSALLLTPSTAAAVLAALRQSTVAVLPTEAPPTPRRATTQEEEALKAAAQSGRLKVVRLEPSSEKSALAILTPTRTILPLPETRLTPLNLPMRGARLRPGVHHAVGSRAPPLA